MKYQIGLVGCGGISSIWKDTISRNPDCRVKYTYDVVPEAAAKRAAEVGAEPAASVEQLLDAEDIDLVIVGTPTFTHANLVVQAARAGKNILCEKPMALTLDQCRRMINACGTAGVKLMGSATGCSGHHTNRVRSTISRLAIPIPSPV